MLPLNFNNKNAAVCPTDSFCYSSPLTRHPSLLFYQPRQLFLMLLPNLGRPPAPPLPSPPVLPLPLYYCRSGVFFWTFASLVLAQYPRFFSLFSPVA